MGSAAHHSGSQLRFGLSATVASAVLYAAVVLLGLGPASSSAQGREADRNTPVVRVTRDPTVSGPGSRLPQVSPGPARRQARHRPRVQRGRVTTVTTTPTAASGAAPGSPASPVTPEPNPVATSALTSVAEASATSPTTTTPSDPDPILTVRTVTVPDLPVTVPTSPVPLAPPQTVQVPTVPSLPLP
jgi:hypothetical protein